MVLDIIAAAIAIAFGFIAIYFGIENKETDQQFLVVLIVGAILVIGGGWYILSTITLWVLLKKLAGFIIGAVGVFLMFGFHDAPDYQPGEFAMTALFIGIILTIVGIYLLFF